MLLLLALLLILLFVLLLLIVAACSCRQHSNQQSKHQRNWLHSYFLSKCSIVILLYGINCTKVILLFFMGKKISAQKMYAQNKKQ